MSNRTWRENQFRCYPIKYEKIIKLPHNDPKVDELIAANVSVYMRYIYYFKCNYITFQNRR